MRPIRLNWQTRIVASSAGLVITTSRSRLASLEVAFGNMEDTSRQDADASTALAVGAAKREASAARGALIDRYYAESAARQGREAIFMARIDATAKAFNRMVTRAAGFMSDFHAKKQTASGAIDALINDSMDQGVMNASYQDSRRRAVLLAAIPS